MFCFRSVGNLQQALVCLEKRLVVSHELGIPEAKAQAYGELGALHIALNNLEQAVSCLEHQKNIARLVNSYSFTLHIYPFTYRSTKLTNYFTGNILYQ